MASVQPVALFREGEAESVLNLAGQDSRVPPVADGEPKRADGMQIRHAGGAHSALSKPVTPSGHAGSPVSDFSGPRCTMSKLARPFPESDHAVTQDVIGRVKVRSNFNCIHLVTRMPELFDQIVWKSIKHSHKFSQLSLHTKILIFRNM
jgi:hypothetical protein